MLPKKPLTSKSSKVPPIVILSPGFGIQKDMGTSRYAEGLASKGLAALAIDYRGFGLSDGAIRNLVSPPEHVADIIAAAEHMATDSRVDGRRLALWGASLSGGHVLHAAAALQDRVKAVISQVHLESTFFYSRDCYVLPLHSISSAAELRGHAPRRRAPNDGPPIHSITAFTQ
jgi:pimeloyl-ACP methyl ester carboxylesterase